MIRCNVCIAQPGEWCGAQYQSTVDAVGIYTCGAAVRAIIHNCESKR